jgi:hypothetical protein
MPESKKMKLKLKEPRGLGVYRLPLDVIDLVKFEAVKRRTLPCRVIEDLIRTNIDIKAAR